MANGSRVASDLAIPPGEYLVEAIQELGIEQAELARRMGTTVQAIHEIVWGRVSITSDIAGQLERETGVSADIWLGLENDYRLALARRGE